ncbi:uncharacterized protein MYCFIDRAFT_211696 [Pseudocercospora fijiensis CIRAD86]|uniref:Uncharacterized protein n=1 Tax=Pseudocercospora fijiensis (strain CIRAD86) TaxID=383855 RepID=M3ATS8_PSEFD|nr:uncharacterized protein MYCFIDRAFT_211696 [Pseudocercospora fijiensis CIRAD86]EME80887.1 hypothetical protein MYCFIDRAFT_211696 [Pseudocercospora fijiensis CIRAD86]
MAARKSSTVLPPELPLSPTQQRFPVAFNQQTTSYEFASGHENTKQGLSPDPECNPKDEFHPQSPVDSSILDSSTISWHTAREQSEEIEPLSPKTPPKFDLQYQKPSTSAKDTQACKRARNFATQQSEQVAEKRRRRTPVRADTSPTKPGLPREPELWGSPPPYFGLPSSSETEQECEARGRARKSPRHEAPGRSDAMAMETD